MDFHRRQRSKLARQLFGLERKSFFGSLSLDQFGRQAGHSDGRFASKRLESCAVDDTLAFFLLKFDPHPEHLSALRVAHRADGVRVGEFPHVLWVAHRLGDSLLEIRVHPNRYLGIFKSTSCAQASMPPRRQRTFSKPWPRK